jgi:NAD-dependent DNA ligase
LAATHQQIKDLYKKITILLYAELYDEIELHNDLYYNKNTPIISDFTYDRLYRDLIEVERSLQSMGISSVNI